jgi:hypothetical protein
MLEILVPLIAMQTGVERMVEVAKEEAFKMLLTTVVDVMLEVMVAAIRDVAGLQWVEEILLQGTLAPKIGSH